MNINEGYNVKLYGVYSAECGNCGKLTSIQDADGEGLCGNCDYRWQFDENREAGRCVKCDIIVTVGNWLLHDTEIGDPREHPIKRE